MATFFLPNCNGKDALVVLAENPMEAALQNPIAYLPLDTYPEAVADNAILAAVRFAASLECGLHLSTFAVNIPRHAAPVGGFLLNVPGLVRTTEEKSKAECARLMELAAGSAEPGRHVHSTMREVALGGVARVAASEARYFDLAIFPWSETSVAAQDLAQAVVFESGRPTILVPPAAGPAVIDHIAIAWDGSRVAARALGDALPLLTSGGRVTVLTVKDEKALAAEGLAASLASSLAKRGFNAKPMEITLGKRSISEALQETAIAEGAKLLAMGGFGHSRLRDFVLGGATRGILAKLGLPTLLSH